MEIKVSRDSVCLADDMFDHTKTYQMGKNATYIRLFYKLKWDRYFPNVAGNNVVWVLTTERCECVFSYFTKTNKFSMGICELYLRNICGSSCEVHFKYYSSPEKWKEKILEMYKGDDYSMWRDGWVEELEYCERLIVPLKR